MASKRMKLLKEQFTDEKLNYLDEDNLKRRKIAKRYSEEIVNPIESAYDNYISTLNESLNQAEKGGDKTQITINSKALEKTLEERDSYLLSLDAKGAKLHANTNPIRQFEANKAVKLNEIAQQVAKSSDLKGTYWQEDPLDGSVSLTEKFKTELNQLAEIAQRDFYASSLEKINQLNILNPTVQPSNLIETGNNLIEQDVNQAMEAISRAWDDKVNSLIPKQGEVSPTGTELEKQTIEAKRSGLTEKEAKETALATTLKGDETFDIVDEPGKPVEIDVSKPSKGLFNIGNYEIEDLNEYNLLFENTKATGAFKGNQKAVNEFFKNRKEILKEGDFFNDLVVRFITRNNKSSDLYSFNPLATGKISPRFSDLEVRQNRLEINGYLKSYLEKKQNDYQDKLTARKNLEDTLWEHNLIRKKTGNYKCYMEVADKYNLLNKNIEEGFEKIIYDKDIIL